MHVLETIKMYETETKMLLKFFETEIQMFLKKKHISEMFLKQKHKCF